MRVLLASSCPTHPPIEGNSRRIETLAASLARLGCEVEFLYLPSRDFPRPDLEAMARVFGERLHLSTTLDRHDAPPRRLVARHRAWSWTGARRAPPQAAYDRRLPAEWHVRIRELERRRLYDAVVVEYVFLSALLRDLPSRVRKVLDTHDVFSGRNARMAALGDTVPWLETTAEDETVGLDRADVVLAIQSDEAATFRARTRARVLTVGHLVDRISPPPPDPGGRPSLLLLGGPHSLNVQGLRWFLEAVWPRIRRAVPDAVFRVAGRLGESLPRAAQDVERLGVVERAADAYAAAHVVVNPVRAGTGLAIKTIEALAHGRALVATPAGARGVAEGAGRAFALADGAEAFAAAAIDLLGDPRRRRELAASASDFAADWNRRQLESLRTAIGLD